MPLSHAALFLSAHLVLAADEAHEVASVSQRRATDPAVPVDHLRSGRERGQRNVPGQTAARVEDPE